MKQNGRENKGKKLDRKNNSEIRKRRREWKKETDARVVKWWRDVRIVKLGVRCYVRSGM